MTEHSADAHRFWENGQGTEAGRVVYERLRQNERPAWAVEILRVVLDRIPGPPEVGELIRLASDSDIWHLARSQFSRIRQVTLRTTEQLPLSCLLLAENVAKVIYNATAPAAPFAPLAPPILFDTDSGWAVVSCAHTITQIIDDPAFTERVWMAIIRSDWTGTHITSVSASTEERECRGAGLDSDGREGRVPSWSHGADLERLKGRYSGAVPHPDTASRRSRAASGAR